MKGQGVHFSYLLQSDTCLYLLSMLIKEENSLWHNSTEAIIIISDDHIVTKGVAKVLGQKNLKGFIGMMSF